MDAAKFFPKSFLPQVAALVLVGACGGAAVDAPNIHIREASTDLDLGNGTSLNGTSLNGTSLNGTSLNGTSLNGTSLNGTSLNGTSLNGVTLNATVFSAKKGSLNVSGTGFAGVTWTDVASNGTSVALKITAVTPLPAPNADLYGYAIAYQNAAGWQPLCGLETDGTPVLAIPMAGAWDYTSGTSSSGTYNSNAKGFSLTCRHHAIAKCVEMGYRPWTKSLKKPEDLLVTCTRVLRADYCGIGVSYTVDGTLIDLFDTVGVQTDSEPTWPMEAQWNTSGATCITPLVGDRYLNTHTIPSCLLAKLPCIGNNIYGSTLITDRYVYGGN